VKRAVFLDRDGVITREPPYYAHKVSQLELLPGAAAAIRRLNEQGFLVVIVSNQAGIGRGYYGEADMVSFNRAMQDRLGEAGARIDAVYFCPHHPEAGLGELLRDCDCRKPKPGMLVRAGEELDIDLRRSFMVGDRATDIEAGKRAGCMTVLVRTGYGAAELRDHAIECAHVAADLAGAADYILAAPGQPALPVPQERSNVETP
jgi:D-glycero-D-manno-heptose 1,7-bisphosphate phosphatase